MHPYPCTQFITMNTSNHCFALITQFPTFDGWNYKLFFNSSFYVISVAVVL